MRQKGDLPVKTCARCARPMVWRKKWEKTWDEVKYCSERCRRDGKSQLRSSETIETKKT